MDLTGISDKELGKRMDEKAKMCRLYVGSDYKLSSETLDEMEEAARRLINSDRDTGGSSESFTEEQKELRDLLMDMDTS